MRKETKVIYRGQEYEVTCPKCNPCPGLYLLGVTCIECDRFKKGG